MATQCGAAISKNVRMSEEKVLPLIVLVPESGRQPIEVRDERAALRFAVVERNNLKSLGKEWDKPGLYLLLDRPGDDGTFGCYVGKAPAGVRARLRSHARAKEHWYRAVLIRRNTYDGFHSAQVGWLEGRLYDLLAAAADVRLHNGNRPSDETLPAHDRANLETYILPIERVLYAIGHYVGTPTVALAKPPKPRESYDATLKSLVDAGLIAAGTPMVSTNTRWPAKGIIHADGTLEHDGKRYTNPSPAATAACNGIQANGWTMWAVEMPDGTMKTLAAFRSEYLTARPTT
jgi:hypothetical protein